MQILSVTAPKVTDFYVRVWRVEESIANEYDINDVLDAVDRCGREPTIKSLATELAKVPRMVRVTVADLNWNGVEVIL